MLSTPRLRRSRNSREIMNSSEISKRNREATKIQKAYKKNTRKKKLKSYAKKVGSRAQRNIKILEEVIPQFSTDINRSIYSYFPLAYKK